MNRNTKIILFSVIGLLIAGMAFYPTIKKHLKKEDAPQGASGPGVPAGGGGGRGMPLNVNAKIVQPETLENPLTNPTSVTIPDEDVDLTFESSGKITGIFFQEGSYVKKGDLLAKINDKPLQAELQKLEAQIPLAEGRVFRHKALLDEDAVSKEAYEQVSTELDKLRGDIGLIKARIAQTELVAPFDGNIGLRKVSEGAYASPSTIITTLTKTVPLKLEFSINEKNADYIYQGMEISFTIDGDLSVYKATVYAIESRVDLDLRTLKIRALYPNTNGKLRPGRTAYLDIRSKPIHNTFTAPSESIIKEMGINFVYIYSGGRAKRVSLELGMRTESHTQVISGLNAGDTLLISGVMQLRDGLPVKIDNIN